MALYVMVNLDLTEEDGHGMQVPRVGRRCAWHKIRGRAPPPTLTRRLQQLTGKGAGMPFAGDDVVVRRRDDENWALVLPLVYRGNTDTFTVPEDFVTDFASVPRVAVWLIPRFGRYTPAAILHDWLCGPGIRGGLISPTDADGVFRRILRELDVPTVQRWLMWTGVRWSAVTQPHRRPGWWSTAPTVLAISIAALPLVAPPGLAILLGLGLYTLVERVATRGRQGGEMTT